MALSQPVLSFLRPLGPPRPSTFRHMLRFSTATRMRSEPTRSDSTITTAPPPSATADHVSPIPSATTEPSRAAAVAATEANTESDSAQDPTSTQPNVSFAAVDPEPTKVTSKPNPTSKTPAGLKSPKQKQFPKTSSRKTETPRPLLYHVARSANNNYPVYTDYKRGGNLHQTTVRKISGDLQALRDELRRHLEKKQEDVKINDLTKQVIVKGHHQAQIVEYLKSRGL